MAMQRFKRGDVALFVTVVMVGIMYFIMLAISEKTVRDIQAGRAVITSQQAVQVANEGIDAWYYGLTDGTTTVTTGLNPGEQVLSNGVRVNYVVTILNDGDPSTDFDGIRSVGTVTSGDQTITRTLEAGTNN